MKEDEIISLFASKDNPMLDDCHLFDSNKLLSTDSLVEGTHFLLKWSTPQDLAVKLLEVNVSDIFCSGGRPRFCLLNLGLSSESMRDEWIQAFANEFRSRCEFYKIQLVGGDTFSSHTTFLSLTLFGELPPRKTSWQRSFCKPGDRIYLSGSVGLSQLGYKLLRKSEGDKLLEESILNPTHLSILNSNSESTLFQEAIQKHLRPISPYNTLYDELQKFTIHAAMDITDGLNQDSWKLARASQTIMKIYIEKLPRLHELQEQLSIDEILSSGEELEILFTSPDNIPKFVNGYPIAEIGSIHTKAEKADVQFFYNEENYYPKTAGFEHFQLPPNNGSK